MSFEIKEYTGGLISEPGAYANVPMGFYHGQPCVGPSISSSQLRTIFSKSLKHYWDQSPLNPDRESFKDTDATILGRGAHHLLMGESDFSKFFAISPFDSFRTKESKEWKAEQELNGITVLKAEQLEYIRGMAESLAKEAPPGILNGHIELSMFWQDEETGVWLKSRPDAVPNSSGDVADLKCVGQIFDDDISRGLSERGYHQQAALVSTALDKVLGVQMENFFLVYVEQKRPHSVRIQTIDPDDIAAGIEENRASLRLFAKALKTGEWPGPKSPSGDGAFVRRGSWAREWAKRRLDYINQELAA